MIGNKENENLLSNHLYHKDWRDKILGSAEVVVLLELISIEKFQNHYLDLF